MVVGVMGARLHGSRSHGPGGGQGYSTAAQQHRAHKGLVAAR